jgi:hypothetical protein
MINVLKDEKKKKKSKRTMRRKRSDWDMCVRMEPLFFRFSLLLMPFQSREVQSTNTVFFLVL